VHWTWVGGVREVGKGGERGYLEEVEEAGFGDGHFGGGGERNGKWCGEREKERSMGGRFGASDQPYQMFGSFGLRVLRIEISGPRFKNLLSGKTWHLHVDLRKDYSSHMENMVSLAGWVENFKRQKDVRV